MKLTIATEEEKKELNEIFEEAKPYFITVEGRKPLPPLIDIDTIIPTIPKELAHCLSIRYLNQLVGYMWVFEETENSFQLLYMYIAKKYRNLGLGKLTIQELERYYLEKGFLTAKTLVSGSNVLGVSFWISVGFDKVLTVEASEVTGLISFTELEFKKNLSVIDLKEDMALDNSYLQNDSIRLQRLFNQLDELFLETEYNGVYGIVNAQEILHTGKVGFSNFEEPHLFEEKSKTCIGSVTKQFVATALLMLQEESKVDLGTSLNQYFPEYPFSEKITLLQMIQMSSGIPDYTVINYEKRIKSLESNKLSEEERSFLAEIELGNTALLTDILSEISSKPLEFEPGSQFSYSNTNYYLLGEVITKITGEPYGNYLKFRLSN